MANTACGVEEIPACPGRCFEFTLVEPEPRPCSDIDGGGGQIDVSFTDVAQTGYRGRHHRGPNLSSPSSTRVVAWLG